MDLDSLIQYTLLELVVLVFVLGVIIRIAFFLFAIIKGSKDKDFRWRYILTIFGRFFLPFHSAITKKTIYAIPRYIFHVCLIVVPIWFSGHIFMWEQYGFDWHYTALPDEWIEGLTLLLLFLTAYFLIRRIILKLMRANSMKSDYFVIIITGLPFLTGYFLTNGSLDNIAFLGDNMETIHVLTAEAMILMIVFLFCRIKLSEKLCTGCASCELSCPTEALTSDEMGKRRIFSYAQYLCIRCGSCINTCPEGAAVLRHEISLARFFQIVSRQPLRSVALKACERCGALFAPESQVEKLGQTITDDYIRLCFKCKRKDNAEKLLMIS